MKLRLITIFFLLAGLYSFGQDIHSKVVDSLTGKPLAYVTIIYKNNARVTYTDTLGEFVLDRDSVEMSDNIQIELLGYEKFSVSASKLMTLKVIALRQSTNTLAPVIVQSCQKVKQVVINKRVGHIKQYVGPGPETRLIVMAMYTNNKNSPGYVDNIQLLMNEVTSNFKVPVRLHWYDWDENTHAPGKELTDTNLVMYATTKGWNNFSLPKNRVYFDKDNLVFGIEFIYPVEEVEQYKSFQTSQQKMKWLKDMTNRWSLGLQQAKNADEGSFYIMNNLPIQKYGIANQTTYFKPAIRFTVTTCKNK